MKPLLVLTAMAAVAFGNGRKNAAAFCPIVVAGTFNPSARLTPRYSSFSTGEPANAKTGLLFWRNRDNNKLDNSFPLLADSVEFILPDDTGMYGDRKTVWNNAKAYRSSFTQMKSEADACLPVKTTGKGHQWVAIWGREHHTTGDGEKESVDLHEVWRFNRQGKVIGMSQYGAGVNGEGKRRLR